MIKSLKIFKTILAIIIFLFVLLFGTNIYAVDIDMNLTNIDTLSNNDVSNSNTNTNTSANTSSNKTNTSTNSTTNTSSNTTNTSATVSSVSSLPESELGLTNILNILLITVGFILILLAIAILIKLRK